MVSIIYGLSCHHVWLVDAVAVGGLFGWQSVADSTGRQSPRGSNKSSALLMVCFALMNLKSWTAKSIGGVCHSLRKTPHGASEANAFWIAHTPMRNTGERVMFMIGGGEGQST